ncbi:ATP-binding protein [Pedobacter agri]|uniref:ATP-binding protein n=1 Tax=Pedobacter agri TaxID=454586 RepID=UPI0029314DEF|nr:ATP-binding protein [Pedobacter agri]
MNTANTVSIRPKVSMLTILKHIEYETWFALSEFIDNAIASYLTNQAALEAAHGDEYKLIVKIELNEFEEKIIIRDNAAGIALADYARAFRAAEIPPDNSGLSEFGMGMKSAACWFADHWTVTTSALGEEVERKVTFDLNEIYHDQIEELDIMTSPSSPASHYTKIELFNTSKMPRKKAVAVLKGHLSSIYRDFLRNGKVIIKVDTEELSFSETKVLSAAQYNLPDSQPVLWRKEIDFNLSEKTRVKGFVAIREKASTTHAGFALFRRGRVIQGSYDTGFRPPHIFGQSNSYRYQRIFGELHLEGFEVNFTKKGIQWDDKLEAFLKQLKEDISAASFPLFQQAEQYRARATEKEYKNTSKTLESIVKDFEKKAAGALAETLEDEPSASEPDSLPTVEKAFHKSFSVTFNGTLWAVQIELSYEESDADLLEILNQSHQSHQRDIFIRISLTHPFMVEYVGTDNGKLEPVLRMAAILAISEVLAKESGIKTQGEIRRNFNELIYNLSK